MRDRHNAGCIRKQKRFQRRKASNLISRFYEKVTLALHVSLAVIDRITLHEFANSDPGRDYTKGN